MAETKKFSPTVTRACTRHEREGGRFGIAQRLSADLKAVTGFDCRASIAQIDQEIAIIEAGLPIDT
jgi:hypothetical protein